MANERRHRHPYPHEIRRADIPISNCRRGEQGLSAPLGPMGKAVTRPRPLEPAVVPEQQRAQASSDSLLRKGAMVAASNNRE